VHTQFSKIKENNLRSPLSLKKARKYTFVPMVQQY